MSMQKHESSTPLLVFMVKGQMHVVSLSLLITCVPAVCQSQQESHICRAGVEADCAHHCLEPPHFALHAPLISPGTTQQQPLEPIAFFQWYVYSCIFLLSFCFTVWCGARG